MEVLFGPPTFSIEVQPSTTYSSVSLSPDNPFPDGKTHNGSAAGLRESGSGSSIGENSSGSSSSIGVPDDDSEEDDEVQSKPKEGGLCGLDSLEDALPIKKGLSSHFSGKSKSFASLSDAIQVKDLEKPENAFNKRRRILMASKWSRKGFYKWPNPKSMPLLALNEDKEEEEEEEQEEETQPGEGSDSEERDRESDEEDDRRRQILVERFHDRKLVNGFKSKSCFDLQEYEQQ